MNTAVLFSSKTDQHPTPQAFFDQLDREFGFILDVAADNQNTKAPRYFTKETDGLTQDWVREALVFGWPGRKAVWMNPPYGREIGKWVQKAYEESLKGITVVCLLPSRTDTKWFQDYCLKAECRFVRGRLKFGDAKNSAPFPSVVVVFRPPA
jgi:phage N-6-adenine-methyltransferase